MNNIAVFGPRLFVVAAGLLLLAGCEVEPPQFHLNMIAIDQAQIPEPQQQDVANILDAMFGTPDVPVVLADTGLDVDKLKMAAGPVRSDQFGRETGLYRRHCVHCHGTTGDGQGPTALLLNPYPRDYRQGKFKFKSTERAAKPTDADLELVLRNGVPGTAMPSFNLLPDAQIKALIEYVKYLSIRGETEIHMINAIADLSEGVVLEQTRGVLVDELLKPVAETWTAAGNAIIQPEKKPDIPLAESIAAGRKLFYEDKANCAKCHGWGALGDGQRTDYDDWAKPLVELAKGIAAEQESLDHDTELPRAERNAKQSRLDLSSLILKDDALPPRTAVPRNLRQGIYRGGRRPLDIYRRIYAGINGVPMPGSGPPSPGAPGALSPNEIWSLVDYVRSLPYQAIDDHPRQKPLMVGQAGL
jgi:mono/diheme cytochrome c family protein